MTGRDRFTALVPTQLATLLAHPDAAAALATFRAVLVGGQRMVPRLAERAEALGIRVVSTYGGTETSGGCVYDGVPLPGVRVKTVGESIRVSGPVLASGYLESGHQGRSEFLTEGRTRWFRTGDRGQLRDGLLTVHGREDQLIVTGGLKLDLEEVEEALHELPGLDSAVVAPFADEKWGSRGWAWTRSMPICISASAAMQPRRRSPISILVCPGCPPERSIGGRCRGLPRPSPRR
jgi:O-succinylbenzoic acid--CoA ligase